MRFLLVPLLLVACVGPLEVVSDGGSVKPDAGSLALPFEPVDTHGIYLVGQLDGGRVEFESTVTYAAGPGFPLSLRIDGTAMPAYLGNCLSGGPGAVRWTQVDAPSVDGIVHAFLGSNGELNVVVRDVGVTRYVVRGELVLEPGERCRPDAGPLPSPLPFVQQLTFDVRAVAGIYFQPPYSGCTGRALLPAGAEVPLPWPRLVDARGQLFQASNAKRVVTHVVSAEGGVEALDGGKVRFGPGEVTLSADASVPLTGMTSLTVVEPSQVTAFQAHWAKHVWSKVREWEPLDGGPVDVSGGNKQLALLYDVATVSREALCAPPPESWYRHETSTPAVCSAAGAVLANGVCRLQVTVPGSQFSWSLEANLTGVE